MKKPMSKTKKIIYDILFVIALAVFLFSAYKLISIYYLNYQEGKEKDAVQERMAIKLRNLNSSFALILSSWLLYIIYTDVSFPTLQIAIIDNRHIYPRNSYQNNTNHRLEHFIPAVQAPLCKKSLNREILPHVHGAM